LDKRAEPVPGSQGACAVRDVTTSQVMADPRVREPEFEARSLAQLKMLHSVAAQLNRLDDVRKIGEAITEGLRTVVEYHNCRVFLLQPDAETLVPVAFRGELLEYQGETFDALVTRVGHGVTGHVAETGHSYYTPDAMNDPFASTIPGTPDVDESMLAVPLTYGVDLIGVVVLSKLGIDQFDDQDLRLLEVLASHAAVALENARLLKSEREAAAKALESEARNSAILESALDGVIVIDEEGKVVEFNPAAEQIFGYSRADVIGRDMARFIIPEKTQSDHRAGLERYRSTGTSHVVGRRMEMVAVRSNGTEFPVELAIRVLDLPGRTLFTGYLRDITDRKQAEMEVQRALETERQASQRLRELDDLKNMFLEAVSHDLRTPLTAILGLSLTLDRQDLELAPDDREDLTSRLAANARKLDRILCNLLDLERLIRGVVEPNREPTDLAKLVRRVLNEADFLEGRAVTVDAPHVVADVDPAKVERIVENLLVNSARHTPPGTPVWVRVARRDGAVLIVVEDAGPGVEPELREAIFEPFRQGRPRVPAPGAGIGLSVVARFAQLHGGRAWVEARSGGGASFRVVLPSGNAVA
jgi:PAS domain S-box-containing protein